VTCPGSEELLGWLDGDAAEGQAHVDQCVRCAAALEGMRRVRALARVVGGARTPRRPARPQRAPRFAPRFARAMSTMAAVALFAAFGAESALRRRIDRGDGAGEAPLTVHTGSAVFWTSAAVATRVGR
jgi:hypothetical protein